jgi:hypothetical protein
VPANRAAPIVLSFTRSDCIPIAPDYLGLGDTAVATGQPTDELFEIGSGSSGWSACLRRFGWHRSTRAARPIVSSLTNLWVIDPATEKAGGMLRWQVRKRDEEWLDAGLSGHGVDELQKSATRNNRA